MRRYWIVFDRGGAELPLELRQGCGVTARDYEDALVLVGEQVFRGAPLPPIASVLGDVDVSTLDEHHIRPNTGTCAQRGIWFPLGYPQP